jgi:hypothetical protein
VLELQACNSMPRWKMAILYKIEITAETVVVLGWWNYRARPRFVFLTVGYCFPLRRKRRNVKSSTISEYRQNWLGPE